MSPVVKAEAAPEAVHTGAVQILAGFLLSGFLLALLGAVLPAWGYHRDPPNFIRVGHYFLCLALGLVAAVYPARRIMGWRGVSFLLVLSCGMACLSLMGLGWASPPVSSWWRAAGLTALGFSSGLLNMALFYAVSRSYEADAAKTINHGGIWYGLGCLGATVLGAGALQIYRVEAMLALMAIVPAVFGWIYVKFPVRPGIPAREQPLRDALSSFRSPGAFLFALLLFFQFGNEWSIAGWLPIFLIRRVGLSPKAAILTLALYWFFLLAGRLLAISILGSVRHGRLLVGSVASALFGCLILFSTENAFGAASGAFFVGAGYASVYPLVSEAIGRRFSYYHPGFFNGIFSLALLGGLLAPATLGYAANQWGVGVIVGIPLLGTCMVMLLILAIWIESRVTAK